MKTIWKYMLGPKTTIMIPVGAEILTLREQMEAPHIWALVDPNAEREERTFCAYGTGFNIPDNPGRYVGTLMRENERLVFHVFEEEKARKA